MHVPRVTISRIMIATAVFAVSLEAFRVHLSLGSVAACVLCLAAGRAFVESDRSRKGGRALSGLGEAALFVDSTAVALAIFVASAFSCFAATLLIRLPFWHTHQELQEVFNPFGFGIGLIVGTFVCGSLRRTLWPYAPPARQGRDESGAGAGPLEETEEDSTPLSRAGVS
jgi:hypothetical protein